FRRELARARTFGFMRDVAKLWSAGYALGASFENTLVVNEDRLLNPDGLRFADEFARHKALDAIGDLALAGAPLLGAYRSVRGGHKLNHAVVTALMADQSAWTYVEMPETVRRVRGHADLATGFVAPAYRPDVSGIPLACLLNPGRLPGIIAESIFGPKDWGLRGCSPWTRVRRGI